MSQFPPPFFRDQRKVDANHLNLLSVFHFVGAGLAVIGMLFLLGHYLMFSTFLNNPKMWEGTKGTPPPAEFFAMFKWFYVFFGLWLVGSFVLNVLAGIFLRARKYLTFTLIVAGFNCLHMPLGTILGVFTFVVLLRDSVAALYEANANGSQA